MPDGLMLRTFKIRDPQLKTVLDDFRVGSPAGIKVFRHLPLDPINSIHRPIRLAFEVLNFEDWTRPSLVRRWLAAARPVSLSSSINPCVVALLIGLLQGFEPDWLVFWPSLLGVLCIHLGVNFLNDYENHLRLFTDFLGTRASGGSGVIQKLWIPAWHLRLAGIFSLCLGVLFGLPALVKNPLHIGGLGAVALLGAWGYSGKLKLKYRALGDGAVILLLGPGVMAGLSLATFGRLSLATLVAGVFFGFLAEGALHSNNLQEIPLDTNRNIKTIAKTVGFRAAKNFLIWIYCTSFGLLAMFSYTLKKPMILLVGAMMVLPVVLVLREVMKADGPLSASIIYLKQKTEAVHLGFSLMLIAVLSILYLFSSDGQGSFSVHFLSMPVNPKTTGLILGIPQV